MTRRGRQLVEAHSANRAYALLSSLRSRDLLDDTPLARNLIRQFMLREFEAGYQLGLRAARARRRAKEAS